MAQRSRGTVRGTPTPHGIPTGSPHAGIPQPVRHAPPSTGNPGRPITAKADHASFVVEVRSLARAREFLAANGMLGESDARSVAVAPARIGGLRVLLVQP